MNLQQVPIMRCPRHTTYKTCSYLWLGSAANSPSQFLESLLVNQAVAACVCVYMYMEDPTQPHSQATSINLGMGLYLYMS